GEHRVREVRAAAGGKGLNVARVLAELGVDAICAGPLGGGVGQELCELLDPLPSIRQAWTPIAGTTRRTVTVVGPGGATAFNEPGPAVTPAELRALRESLTTLVSSSDPRIEAVTLNGSLPPGLTGSDLAHLIRAAFDQDRPVLVDTSGPALLTAARAGATVLKPNAAEAMDATGTDTPLEAAAALIGARAAPRLAGPAARAAQRQSDRCGRCAGRGAGLAAAGCSGVPARCPRPRCRGQRQRGDPAGGR